MLVWCFVGYVGASVWCVLVCGEGGGGGGGGGGIEEGQSVSR